MINKNIPVVDISIGANMYKAVPNMPNTPSHVLAEFIDNALQSFRDKQKELLNIDPDYRFKIDIKFLRNNETDNIEKIVVEDNAGGIDTNSFVTAFKLAVTPENNQGLNEFGMGLKTASLWLGEVWTLTTTALNEDICRTVTFDLNKVLQNSLNKLDVVSKTADVNEHYTKIEISSLTPKVPSEKNLPKIKEELSSIYRKSLRNNEADIYFDGEKLSFKEIAILVASPANNLKAKPVKWKKEIDFSFGKYHAKGFIGILKDINSTKNGIVLLRRGRVVHGTEDDGRYFPKSLCGSLGTFRYKRIFGELELDGFDVSFNKNDIQNKEDLEALMEALRGEIHTKDFDLYNQAEEYRLDDQQKRINKVIQKHNENKKKYGKIEIKTRPLSQDEHIDKGNSSTPESVIEEPTQMGKMDDTYIVSGEEYKLNVEFELHDKDKDLVWLDVTHKDKNVVTCKININNTFYMSLKNSAIAINTLLKTLALAKFIAKEKGNDTTGELFTNFNEYIKDAKI